MMYGQNITQLADLLKPLKFESLCQAIQGKFKNLNEKISELRQIKQIDTHAYRKLKIQLPYFTIAQFNPPYRKSENVAYADYLIIDLDYLSQKQYNIHELKSKISKNSNVSLCFISPGFDGLKVLFKLEPYIYDKNIYKLFYKLYAVEFCRENRLEQVIDTSTCDITRATFFSYDPELYINNNAIPLDYQKYIDLNNTIELQRLEQKIKEEEKKQKHQQTDTKNDILNDDTLLKIKQLLNPQYKPPKKNIYVPQELNTVIPELQQYLNQVGLEVERVENIHYGKKIVVKLGFRWAELNIFYGKKGFSVVKTPKNGSDGELCEVTYQYIKQYLEI